MERREEDMQPYLSVIIPAYTEEKRIGKTLEAVYDYLRAQTFSWELLIVLDGPTDNTPAIVADFAQGKAGIRWIFAGKTGAKATPCVRACWPPVAKSASSPTPTIPPT